MNARHLRKAATALAWTVALTCGAALLASWVTGFVPSIPLSEDDVPSAPTAKKTIGSMVAPLEGLDFDAGDWAAYILLEPYDYVEVRKSVPRSCLKLTDREELKRLQRELVARYTGGDVATVLSSLVIVHDRKIVYSSGIVLRGRDLGGLQTSSWGWLEPEDRRVSLRFADRFTPVYWPVCIL